MMVLDAKVMPKLFGVVSPHHTTATIKPANHAPVVRCWNTELLWGPWLDCCMGVRRSGHSWHVAVAQKWVRQGAWAKDHFQRARGPTWRSAIPTMDGVAQ